MKHFVLRNAPKWAAIAGAICLALAAAILYAGIGDSRKTQIMAENLGKDYAGGGWYPANGTDYDLEARIVGHGGWVTRALNAERSDQIEVRLRIASSDNMQLTMTANILEGRFVLGNRPSEGRISAVLSSAGLKWVTDATAIYDSPDIMHVAYIPVGVYAIEDDIWSRVPGAYSIGVTYDGADGPIYREMLIVPPDSEVDFRAIVGFAIAGIVCLCAVSPIMAGVYRRYKRKCYDW